jgi:hypothetical protein
VGFAAIATENFLLQKTTGQTSKITEAHNDTTQQVHWEIGIPKAS